MEPLPNYVLEQLYLLQKKNQKIAEELKQFEENIKRQYQKHERKFEPVEDSEPYDRWGNPST